MSDFWTPESAAWKALAEKDELRLELELVKDHNKRLLRNLGLEIGINNLLMADWLTQEEKDILIELQNE